VNHEETLVGFWTQRLQSRWRHVYAPSCGPSSASQIELTCEEISKISVLAAGIGAPLQGREVNDSKGWVWKRCPKNRVATSDLVAGSFRSFLDLFGNY
jgi:hypothetical protein